MVLRSLRMDERDYLRGGFTLPGRITVLPEDLTRKIAAGEVVERPASIVKELIENALDAGATDINVLLERGGCSSIRIIDNGEGIDPMDVPLAFERYATSKIYQFDDIYRVASYGFRGEALPSIASISRVEMITRKRSSLSGTKIIVEAGLIKLISEAGCPVGTSVFVSQIFDPVPVRRKFLKTDTTEQGHCMDVITKVSLAHPGVRFKVVANGKDVLNVPVTENESERISLVLGMDFMNHMLTVKMAQGKITIHGLVSRPEQTRSSTKHLYFYVNRRYVRDYLLNHAVLTAYRRLIETKRYPSAVLFIDLPQDEVDVNVHPTKMEVRFRNPRSIYDMTVEALVSVLSSISPSSGMSTTADSPGEGARKHASDYRMRIEEALKRYTLSSGDGKLFFNHGGVHLEKRHPDKNDLYKRDEQIADQPDSPGHNIVYADLEYLGQVSGTYLVFSSPGGLTILDQHAAHERVLFEKLKGVSCREGDKMISQRLLLPEVVSLSPGDFTFLMECIDILEYTGMEVESFGGNAVVVKSIPAILSHVQPSELIADLLDAFSGESQRMKIQERKDKVFAFLACRGAVKANHKLSVSEVTMLCRDLDNTSFSSTCPHGRPVQVSIGFNDLEKMFGRK
jgi:DNA mismatch repair protein MutL